MKSNGGRVPADWLLPAMESVLFALGEVHKQGLIHRDVSPDNIVMLRSGQMKILDFGTARNYTDEGGKSLSVVLKPGYAPSEQYTSKGRQGPWSDIYALAATIYKCLTGITPPDAMDRMLTDELQTPAALGIWLPVPVENVLQKALSVHAKDRYQTMEEFHQALYGGTAARPGMPYSHGADNNSDIQENQERIHLAKNSQIQKPSGKDRTVLITAAISSTAALIVAVVAVVFLLVSISEKNRTEDMVQTAGNNTDDVQLERKQIENGNIQTGEPVTESPQDTEQGETEDKQEQTDEELGDQRKQDEKGNGMDSLEETPSGNYNEMFEIDGSTPENYASNLNPDSYIFYDSAISDFKFSYPAALYCQADLNIDEIKDKYGYNIQRVTFHGADGGKLVFSVTRRADGMSLGEMTGYVYEAEMGSLKDGSQIKQTVEEEYGRVIVTGYTDRRDMLIYDLTKIEQEYVLQMLVIFPQYTSKEDELQKGYVTECLYRMCGFSGSSAGPRSFEEYQAYWEENL